MSRQCELTGIKPLSGNNVSHANNKTRMRQVPNLLSKRYDIPELKKKIQVRLSTRAVRTIDKYGSLSAAIFKVNPNKLSDQLRYIRKQIQAR